LGEEGLRAFVNAHEQFRNDFPRIGTAQGINIQIRSGGEPVPVPGLAVVFYQEFNRDGQLNRSLQAQQQSIIFAHSRYTSWSEICPQARQTIETALTIVPNVQLQSFGLEYVDRFTSSDSYSQGDIHALFRRGTHYLVPKVFDVRGVWHSHHGSLEEGIDQPHPHSKNDNINIDLIRDQTPEGKLAINMVLRHRRILAQPVLASAAMSHFDYFMDEMHNANVVVMRDLLTKEALRAINLKTADANN